MTSTLAVVLFNLAGTSPVKHLAYANGVRMLDELDADGSFSFSVPVEQAGELQVGSVVKFALGAASDAYVFAGVVETVKLEKAGATTGGVSRTFDVSGRGLRGRLEDAVVYPVASETTRTFTDKTPGFILLTLINEAQARGALTGLTKSFTSSVGTDAVAWAETLTLDEQVGATVSQIANNLQELACDVWVTPDLAINAANARGVDRTTGVNPVTLRVGGSVSELSEEKAGPIRNTVLVGSGTSGATFTTRTSAGSVSTYGRRETFLSLANTNDSALVTLASDQVLNNSAIPADGVTAQLDPTGPQAYLHFDVGDIIFLVDSTGTKTSYRVRALTVTQDDAGLLQFIPELGTARANLDKRLARALARIERGNAGGETDIGYDPEPEGGGADFEVCTVVSYDSGTRSGNADCSGTSTDFDNGSIYDFFPGDDILITETTDGDKVSVGLLQSGGGGVGSQFGFVPIGTVPGLPYDVGAEGVGTIFQAGEGFITNAAGGTVFDFVTPNTFVLSTPVGFTNSLALSKLPTGTFVFQRGADNDATVTTNSLVVIHNNVASTYNYGGVRTIGVSNGVVYCYATHKGGLADRYFITVNSSGVVADFFPTVQDELGNVVSFVGPTIQPSASGSWWLAGDYGVAWSPFVGGVRYIYTFAHGTTAARRWPSAVGNFVYGLTTAQRFGRITMDDSHIFAIDTQGLGTKRSWRRMNLTTGIINDFPDNLPVGAVAASVAAGGNEAILIAGSFDDGTGAVAAFFTTSGSGVTVTTLADTSSPNLDPVVVRRDFTGNVLGSRRVASLSNRAIVIGITLS